MSRWGMVIDLEKCNGCEACAAACQAECNQPPVGESEARMGRKISWLKISEELTGKFPDLHRRMIPQPCMQCDDPPCVRVCPVHATYLGEGGIVAQIYQRCIGCRFCMAACPYTVKYFNWYNYAGGLPAAEQEAMNPEVSPRPRGVVEKCTFCHHRLLLAKDQARLQGNDPARAVYHPACEEACPAKAIYFGDLDDSTTEVARLAQSHRASRLMEDLGTNPKVYYLARKENHG